MTDFDTRIVDELAAADDMSIPLDLEEAFFRLHNLYANRNTATEELKTKIIELETELEALSEPYNRQIMDLQEKIEAEVKLQGSAFKCSYGKATYRKEYERSSWDSKALMGYAAAHPEIEQFKNITLVEASVTISVGDLK
jgi:hypothetical protein